MSSQSLLQQAINPDQYDSDEMRWETERSLDNPYRRYFFSYLEPFFAGWKDKSVLDIGAGTGWLVEEMRKRGVANVEGIEPSQKNVALAHKFFPQIHMEKSSLDEYTSSGKTYDVSIMLMVLVHCADLQVAFRSLHSLLNKGGEAICVVPDYDYFLADRPEYEVQIEQLNPDEYVVAITRPKSGAIVDIVRKTPLYAKAAEASGFTLRKHVPMLPNEELLSVKKHMQPFADKPVFHLLHFVKA